MPVERRRTGQIRFPVQVPTVAAPLEAVWDPIPAATKNLSQSGLLIQQGRPMQPGASVRITLRLQKREPFTLMGKVAWAQPHSEFSGWDIGIRFEGELPGHIVAEIADEEQPDWYVSPSCKP